jgi:6-phosphogluconolactonase
VNGELQVVSDAEALYRRAAYEFARRAQAAVGSTGRFAVALSGGGTPKGMYRVLAQDPTLRREVPWGRVHFFFGDERHVPPGHADSNYRAAHEALLSQVPVPEANIWRIPGEECHADVAAGLYEAALRQFFQLSNGPFPRFDLVLLGLGADGHTASLFPGTTALRETRRLAAPNWVDKLGAYRITLTPPVFNRASCVIFLVAGADKATALQAAMEGRHDPEHIPARLIEPADGELIWLVDQAAARLLGAELN